MSTAKPQSGQADKTFLKAQLLDTVLAVWPTSMQNERKFSMFNRQVIMGAVSSFKTDNFKY